MAPYLNISMSYSRKASVVMTFAPEHWWQDIVALPVPTLASKTGLMVWVSSNCRPDMTYHRDTLVKELMEHVHIEARGKCLNNAPRFEGNYGMGHKLNYVSARVAAVDCLCAVLPRCSVIDRSPKCEFAVRLPQNPYKFALVMENSIEVDWVTEKFYLPFLANTVPVYYGAPNIEDYAPGPHSFINMRDFDSPAALGKYLKELAEDEAAYSAFFAWRKTQQAPSASLAQIQAKSMYRDDLACDLCKCICDTSCANSAAKILEYPHFPQLSPWTWAVKGKKDPGNAFGRKQGRAFALHDDQFHQDYIKLAGGS